MSFWSWIGLADKNTVQELKDEIKELQKENRKFQEQNQTMIESVLNNCTNNYEKINYAICETGNKLEVEVKEIQSNVNMISQAIDQINKKIEGISSQVSNEHIKQIDEMKSLQDLTKKMGDNLSEILSDQSKAIKEEYASITSSLIDNGLTMETNRQIVLDRIQSIEKNISDGMSLIEGYSSLSQNTLNDNNAQMSVCIKQIEKNLRISSDLYENTNNLNELQKSIDVVADSIKNLWTITKALWVDRVLTDIDSAK